MLVTTSISAVLDDVDTIDELVGIVLVVLDVSASLIISVSVEYKAANEVRSLFKILVNSSLPPSVLKNSVDVRKLVCVVGNELVIVPILVTISVSMILSDVDGDNELDCVLIDTVPVI